MNAKGILDQLMRNAGGQRSARGSGDTVDRLLQGLKSQLAGGSGQRSGGDMKSLLGGGALALLVGSKRGRRLGGSALKYGVIAGLGTLAWKAWQNHQASQAGGAGDAAQEGEPIERLQGDAGERRSLEVLQAMIMTARADGHVDETESAQLTELMNALGADADLRAWMEQQIQAPLDADALAREADSPQAAREMYLAGLAIADDQNPMERAWLEQLAKALGIDPALASELKRQASQSA
jgi:uncharacterized membrane protein YebE (DUF533 family)